MALKTEKFVYELINEGYTHLCVVPCSFAKYLINEAINNTNIEYIPCASEAVACSIAAGLKISGKSPIVIVQSSGLTNMGSCITSLLKPYNITFPIHPKTRKRIMELNLIKLLESSKIRIIKPLSYINNIRYLLSSELIITDSGGMQKEAYFLKKPCFTLRNSTEWAETIEEGWNVLLSNNPKNLKKIIQQYKLPKRNKCSYGKGNTAEKIVHILKGLR